MIPAIPIVLACSDKFSPLAGVTIASLCYFTKSNIHFYILDGGISSFHKKQLELLKESFSNFTLEYNKVDPDKYFNNIKTKDYFSKDVYNRLLIPELFPHLNKAIYLDVDVIAMGDIAELFDHDLKNYAIATVPQAISIVDNSIQTQLGLSPSHIFFNSGVLLLDCKLWRKNNIVQQLIDLAIDIAANKSAHLTTYDQGALNAFFGNNYLSLDYKFNYMTQDYFYFKEYNPKKCDELSNSCVIRHFLCYDKPFLTNKFLDKGQLPNFEDFWFFAKMTPFYAGLKQQFLCSMLNSTQNEMTNKIAKEVTKESVKEIINIKEVMKEMIRIITKK